jgi:RNA polymerase sigma factor (sigma-70 family)
MMHDEAAAVATHRGLAVAQANRYWRSARLAAERRGLDREDLESIALVGLVQAIRAWDPSRGSFSTLATHCIMHELQRALAWTQKRNQCVVVSLDDVLDADEDRPLRDRLADTSAVDPEDAAIARAQLRDGLDRLPTEDRNLILALYNHGCTVREIAERMGTTTQAVQNRHRRVLTRLRNAAR